MSPIWWKAKKIMVVPRGSAQPAARLRLGNSVAAEHLLQKTPQIQEASLATETDFASSFAPAKTHPKSPVARKICGCRPIGQEMHKVS